MCTYQLLVQMGSSYPILAGSYIQVTIPPEVTLGDSNATLNDSSTVGLLDSQLVVSLVSSNTLKFMNVFSTTVNETLDYFTLYISNLTTPRSTQPTSSFGIQILTAAGYTQYKRESGI